jgi:hypothetical protein
VTSFKTPIPEADLVESTHKVVTGTVVGLTSFRKDWNGLDSGKDRNR